MPEEKEKLACPIISQAVMINRPGVIEGQAQLIPTVAMAACEGDLCGKWASWVEDDGSIHGECSDITMARALREIASKLK